MGVSGGKANERGGKKMEDWRLHVQSELFMRAKHHTVFAVEGHVLRVTSGFEMRAKKINQHNARGVFILTVW